VPCAANEGNVQVFKALSLPKLFLTYFEIETGGLTH
jgi:hypothetical protein